MKERLKTIPLYFVYLGLENVNEGEDKTIPLYFVYLGVENVNEGEAEDHPSVFCA